MHTLEQIVCGYLLIMNALGLALMIMDKHCAKKHHRRIPEATLMTVAVLGGSIGSWLGMYLARHKTKHPKFYIGIPLVLTLQIVLAWCICHKLSH